MCSFVTQHNAKSSQVLGERAIGMLTTGMSIRAVATELNVNFSNVSCLQHRVVTDFSGQMLTFDATNTLEKCALNG